MDGLKDLCIMHFLFWFFFWLLHIFLFYNILFFFLQVIPRLDGGETKIMVDYHFIDVKLRKTLGCLENLR